jgi:hypothetical protein
MSELRSRSSAGQVWCAVIAAAGLLAGCDLNHEHSSDAGFSDPDHDDGAAGTHADKIDATSGEGGGGSSGMACKDACADGASRCAAASAATLEVCTVGANGCRSFVASPCATGTVCERTTPAACVDPDFAAWPISNSAPDVANGAPNLTALVDNLDGTVTDKVSGLMWEQRFHQSVYDFGDTFCPTVTTGGYTDWRQPSTIEFISIADYSRDLPNIDPTFFPLVNDAGFFWTGTRVDGYGLEPDIIDYGMFPAIEIAGGFGVDGQPGVNVRCVRSAPTTTQVSGPRYVLGNDLDNFGSPDVATVYDTRTKLTWQQNASGPFPLPTTPTNPIGACAGLTNDTGVVGWRLPTLKELFTLLDFTEDHGEFAMLDNQFFPNAPVGAYLSATSSPLTPVQCAYFTGNFYLTCAGSVFERCVR